MENLFSFVCAHAENAHYLFFGLLMLAGLNIPISEDVLLLTAGALVSRCIPDSYLHLYLWMFFGCWISGWEAYWLGRILGRKLLKYKWFNHALTEEKVKKLHVFYEKFGIFTFIVGRFIPGGVRNALFITAGMGKMPFGLFIIRDFVAALITTNIVFYLGFLFGQNYELILETVLTYNHYAMMAVGLILISLIAINIYKKQPNDDAS